MITAMDGNKNLLHIPQFPISVLGTQTSDYFLCFYKAKINVSKCPSYFFIAEIRHYVQKKTNKGKCLTEACFFRGLKSKMA